METGDLMPEYIKIDTLDNIFEAQRLEAELDERGIPHLIESYHDSAYNGLFQSYRGWGSVQAPESFAAQIREILADLRTG